MANLNAIENAEPEFQLNVFQLRSDTNRRVQLVDWFATSYYLPLPRFTKADWERLLDELDDALWEIQFATHPEVLEHLSAQATRQIQLGNVYKLDIQ